MNDGKLTGRELAGVTGRVPSKKWMIDFIRDADSVYSAGDSYALQLWENDSMYPSMPSNEFSEDEMDKLVSYIEAF
jgi:hypothetical protein